MPTARYPNLVENPADKFLARHRPLYLKWNRRKWRLIERTNLTSLPLVSHYLPEKKKRTTPIDRLKIRRGEEERDLSLKKSERLRRENDSLHLLCKFYSLENDNFRGVNNCASFIRSIDRSNDTYPRSPWGREKRGEKGGAREDQ